MSQAKKTACVSNMKTLEEAVELYVMDNSGIKGLVSQKTLINAKIMEKEYKCPLGGKYTMIIPELTSEVTLIKCSIHKTIDDVTAGL